MSHRPVELELRSTPRGDWPARLAARFVDLQPGEALVLTVDHMLTPDECDTLVRRMMAVWL